MPKALRPINLIQLVNRNLVGAAALVVMTVAAQAQSIDFNDLTIRINRLEDTVATLNRKVYQGDSGGGGAVEGLAPPQAADLVVRVQRLERAIQELTGKYEETGFGINQVKDRLDRLSSDVDFRLSHLEGHSPSSSGDAVGRPAPPSAPPAPTTHLNDRQSAAAVGALTGGVSRPTSPPPPRPSSSQGASAPASIANGNATEQYNQAFALLRQADYDRAEQALSAFVKQNKDNPLAGNAQYWLGETYYVRGKYNEAAVAFAEGFQKYPKNSKAADNLLKLGMSLAQINQTKDACAVFGQLASQIPDAPSSLKKRAEQERARLKCS